MNKSKVAIVVNKTVSIIQMIVAIAIFAFFGLYTLIYIYLMRIHEHQVE